MGAQVKRLDSLSDGVGSKTAFLALFFVASDAPGAKKCVPADKKHFFFERKEAPSDRKCAMSKAKEALRDKNHAISFSNCRFFVTKELISDRKCSLLMELLGPGRN